MGSEPLLQVEGLSLAFGEHHVVDNLSLSLKCGQTLALVGESGSGKTLSGRSIMGLLPRGARVTAGKAVFHPEGGEPIDLCKARERRLRAIRGGRIGMIF
jgi:ABC-type glutathione transport system ATPase component